MIEWRWGLEPMRERDRYVNDFADALDFKTRREAVTPPGLKAPNAQVCCGRYFPAYSFRKCPRYRFYNCLIIKGFICFFGSWYDQISKVCVGTQRQFRELAANVRYGSRNRRANGLVSSQSRWLRRAE
jgi:hypothetical protein